MESRSALDFLDQIGGAKDEFQELIAFGDATGTRTARTTSPCAREEALVAVPSHATSAPVKLRRRPGRARWLTSERALRWYVMNVGRADAGTRRR